MHRSYDVVIATDARLPGGTSASVAEEIRAQAVAGYRTALLHVPSRLVSRDRPFAPRLRGCLERGEAQLLVDPHATVDAQLLVVRHPTVAAGIDPTALPPLRTEQLLLVANQAPGVPEEVTAADGADPAPGPGAGQPATGLRYEPAAVAEHLGAVFDRPVRWVPIGPLVRDDLRRVAPDLELAPADWVNVIDVDAWRRPRTAVRHRIPVIGRHSRDDAMKWPADRDSLLAAYPDRDDVEVHVLGGAAPAERLLGGLLPHNWLVLPFGALPPARFLAGLDVFVYQHHPALVEAFGRSILEAMASGLPTILPAHFAVLFEDAATYTDPHGVRAAVQALHADPVAYRAASQHASAFVAQRFGHQVHRDRLAELATPTGASTLAAPAVVPGAGAGHDGSTGSQADPTSAAAAVPSATGAPDGRVLFISSNGAGVGHLMRLMAYARHLPSDLEPVFLTFSQGGRVVAEQGHVVEYLASRSISGATARAWHPMLQERVGELIERYDVRAVVFDGTWPYQGVLDAVGDHPHVSLVWSRRAMWRRGVTNPVLTDQRHLFDLVVEPGELAADDDRGATRALRAEATRVGPVTYLEGEELLDRAAARAALGLDPARPAALVNLGAGNIDDADSTLRRVLDRLGREPDLQVLVTRSIIAEQQTALPDNVRAVSVYPLARYLHAFDLAVAAAGYNSFHELTLAAVPTVFVPNLATATDDQAARAAFAERTGIGVALHDPTPARVDAALAVVLDAERRQRMHDRAVARRRAGGAQPAMAAIAAVATAGPRTRATPLQLARTADAQHGGEPPSPVVDEPAPPDPGPAAGSPGDEARGREDLARRLRRLRKRSRRRLVRLARNARVRARFGRVFALLPFQVRRAVRRRLRRWERSHRVAAVSVPAALPVPAGRVLPETGGGPRRLAPVLIVVPPLGDEALVDRVVERVAAVQRARGGFAPLLVLGDLAFGAARRYGYLVEVLPAADAHRRLVADPPWEQVHATRIANLLRWYAPQRVLLLPPVGADGTLDHTLAVLAAGLDGLDAPT